MKDHISNTKLEKGDHYYIQTWYKDLFNLISAPDNFIFSNLQVCKLHL